MTGHLITFEGIDFCGKSLQARLLCDHLKSIGLPVSFMREPGGTKISEKIREVLLDRANEQMVKETELLLYSAARAQMIRSEILPVLAQDHVVICDRYYDSTVAYQGYGRQIDLEFIKKLNNFVVGKIRPDLTFLIDLEPGLAAERNKVNGGKVDRLEKEGTDFQRKVRAGYLEIAAEKDNKMRFIVIDGNQPVDEIQTEVRRCVQDRLNLS